MKRSTRAAALALFLAATLAGCAVHPQRVGVPIDERPRPPRPPAEPPAPIAADTVISPPPRVMTPSGEGSLRTLVVRDTLAVSRALKRCAGRNLLPEQETTYGATLGILAETRLALQRGDVARARSLARNARQLVTSLDCP